jgi:deoxyribodipyrimidine photo-lyase
MRDNSALYNASRAADRGVVALYVISPGDWRRHDVASVRVEFTLRALRELSDDLDQLRIPLRIAHAARPGDVQRCVLHEMDARSCDALFFNREYEVNESERDMDVSRRARQKGYTVHAWDDQTLLQPGSVRTHEARTYTVFTPFRKACARLILEQGGVRTLPAPRSNSGHLCERSVVPASVPGFGSCVPAERWPAGERHAERMLKSFLSVRARAYSADRGTPAIPGTSELSAHLASGTISVRRCVASAMESDDGARTLSDFSRGASCWISELLWREFFIHVMHAYPRVCKHRAFRLHTERVRWLDNDEHLEAWKAGRTGVPIVDAGMRQLLAEGWMHNRVRMITAMYLCKNLLIDWRRGEQWFMRNLVDGFLASNNGGWQWCASTGTDAAPYFRVFNPVSQGERYDPEGEYVRMHVPELRGLPSSCVHDPERLPALERSRVNYPAPLVDLGTSRERAIAAFAALRERTGGEGPA